MNITNNLKFCKKKKNAVTNPKLIQPEILLKIPFSTLMIANLIFNQPNHIKI